MISRYSTIRVAMLGLGDLFFCPIPKRAAKLLEYYIFDNYPR